MILEDFRASIPSGASSGLKRRGARHPYPSVGAEILAGFSSARSSVATLPTLRPPEAASPRPRGPGRGIGGLRRGGETLPKARAAERPRRAIASAWPCSSSSTNKFLYCGSSNSNSNRWKSGVTPAAASRQQAEKIRRLASPANCSGRTTSATAATASGSSSKISSNSRSHGFSGRERRRPRRGIAASRCPLQPALCVERCLSRSSVSRPRSTASSMPNIRASRAIIAHCRIRVSLVVPSRNRGALAIVCNSPSRATCA